MDQSSTFDLLDFLPFRLNRLAVEISQNLAEIYRERYEIDIPEWRIIATLGTLQTCTAQHVAESTRMHKTRVSRSVAYLEKRGLIERSSSDADRRESRLSLTENGQNLFHELIPLALASEQAMLEYLGKTQARNLLASITRLERSLGLRSAAHHRHPSRMNTNSGPLP